MNGSEAVDHSDLIGVDDNDRTGEQKTKQKYANDEGQFFHYCSSKTVEKGRSLLSNINVPPDSNVASEASKSMSSW